MKIPPLDEPARYVGLYIVDFGSHVSVGYTAAEVTMLLDSEQYRDSDVYRIRRALPDGGLELEGVARADFTAEDILLFSRTTAATARADFDRLRELGAATPPPCRVRVHLAELPGTPLPHVTAALFPAESTGDIGRWMNAVGFEGGDRVYGGQEEARAYYAARPQRVEEVELWPAASAARSYAEVMNSTQYAVQR